MRRWLFAGVGAAAVGLAGLLAAPALLGARAGRQPEEAPVRPVALPVGQVVLFSSGVGYYQREGTVDGDARVDLTFPTGDINDLLKSMVLRDLDGGRVATVSYDSNAPVERTLKSFAVNLTGNPTFADILHQARGEKAEVALANAAAGTLSGTIVGVEHQNQGGGKEPVDVAVLNLWCSDGMRGVRLTEVQRVRFLNPTIEAEFKKALETLAQSHDAQKKAVSLRLVGEGKRRIKVGYVIESPIWKTSYRLVLGSKKAERPYLQGWAVVENSSDEDWKEVRMALVSGRPISFQMDLYESLYVPRPVITPELFQGLRPVAYDGEMFKDGKESEAKGKSELKQEGVAESNAPVSETRRRLGAMQQSRQKIRGSVSDDEYFGVKLKKDLAEKLTLGESVATAASATKLGDFFQYAIDHPVSLARQKSALLPIVGKDVEASRVSIYNEAVQPKFPLLGLRLKNTSGLHLMQGPVTVFEGSSYAGDARIMDLQPGEERLVSFAIDLGMEVTPVRSSDSGRVLSVKAVKGVVHTSVKNRQIKTYTVKNRNSQERTLLVEHPVNQAFKLIDCKPAETTADLYRFEVKVPAGDAQKLVVTEEREDHSQYVIASSGDEQIKFLLSQAAASEKMKAGLKQAMELRWSLEKAKREVAELRKQLGVIEKDQERLRANLREVPETAKAHKRYLEKFDSQETQIERYQADIKKLDAEVHARDKAFLDFVASFSAE